MAKSRLGKGLSALIPMDEELLTKDEPVTEIEVRLIKPNPFQPRTSFDEDKLEELADSIREHGVIQPVVVRPLGRSEYELVVGERRLRACQKLMLDRIPAVIKEFSNQQMIEIGLIENIQRHDLNPVEEARAYKKLVDEFNLTQEEVARRVSKSRPFVANLIRLLNLPGEILDMLRQGQLSVGHVRPLLALADKSVQIRLAQQMVLKNMTAREAERAVQEQNNSKINASRQKAKEPKLTPEITDIESKLRGVCGTKVRIKHSGDKGRIEIEYYSNDDLDRIISFFIGDETRA